MEKEGLAKKRIMEILEEKLAKDYSYGEGAILGSMCTKPNKFGKKIYCKYIEKNLGDPGLFKGTYELENQLVEEIGRLFNGEDIIGSFTTGGSEANIIAMRIAKELRKDIQNPEFIIPESAHASFDKGGELLGIKLRKARLNENYQVDLEHFKSLINENTCGVLGIAGTTSLGVVDPIEKIGQMIKDRNIFFHVDAAFGGFVLPFLDEKKNKIPAWDFRVKNVDSITADPHKMGMGIIPSGGYFLRNESILDSTGFEIPYLAGGNIKHLHIVGTRAGGPVIAFWSIMKYLGQKGFREIIEKCMNKTYYLVKRISEVDGIKIKRKPVMNVLGLTTEGGEDICQVDKELRKRDWMLGKFTTLNLIRIVVMPHVKKEHLDNFIKELKDIMHKLDFG
ncbi:MAG: tyrosine decarboxylase MfnA [Promethearchaeia archaeon]